MNLSFDLMLAEWERIIGDLVVLVGLFGSFYTLYTKIRAVELKIDGRLSQLLEATHQSGIATGRIDQQKEILNNTIKTNAVVSAVTAGVISQIKPIVETAIAERKPSIYEVYPVATVPVESVTTTVAKAIESINKQLDPSVHNVPITITKE